jgi:hypothetical protein
MSHDPLIALPDTRLAAEAPAHPVVEAPGAALPAPTPEQVRAADGVFADHKQSESDAVAGLIGMWTGVLLLHDLAVEHLDAPKDEDDLRPRPRLPKKDEPAP